MKKIIAFLVLLFFIYSGFVLFCPAVTQWDISIISAVQNVLTVFPVTIPLLVGSELYWGMIIINVIGWCIYFYRKYLLIDMLIIISAPVVAYYINSFVKICLHRPRPPMELQIAVHSHSFSYVSRHSFVTFVFFAIVIYYLNKYCTNKYLKFAGILISVLWILFMGICRIWLGVHYPTDVIGGYLLAIIVSLVYIKLIKLIGGKC